jgi:hypothetical protein
MENAMDETEIKNKLDQLAEFHAKRDMLEFEKRKLLEENKVPEYVQAIVNQGMKKMAESDRAIQPTLDTLHRSAEEKRKALVIPEEIKAALEKIDEQRAQIEMESRVIETAMRKGVQQEREAIQADIDAQTKAVFDATEARKRDIEAEFFGKNEAADANIKALENEIKAAVKELKTSVKASHFNAVYVSGRITWNTDKMEAWRVAYPFLNDARREGEPSITLRRI